MNEYSRLDIKDIHFEGLQVFPTGGAPQPPYSLAALSISCVICSR